ncbi:hypothetical protein PGTUg99_022091 [Puccinia graminis f. sp. tritici]|uniref:Uncharacterized protein n=1 Tax=Puccinia graminis f. sp. tritici TaxID=56615 RepID=A0A5B0QLM6_PUCGR|nr:hypothetical protein PGTUg99_022091 [Puccinia graminis f. sp. tritici]
MHVKSVTVICCLAGFTLGAPMEAKDVVTGCTLGSGTRGPQRCCEPPTFLCLECGKEIPIAPRHQKKEPITQPKPAPPKPTLPETKP